MTHPRILHALTAVYSLRQAYRWLRQAVTDEAVQRVHLAPGPSGPPRSRAALRRFDQLLQAERADRIHADRAGITQVGSTAAPVRPELLDAQRRAELAAAEQAWELHYALMFRPLVGWGPQWVHLAGDRWLGTTGYLLLALTVVDPVTAGEVAAALRRCDAALRSVLRAERSLDPLPGSPPCPACGERRLRVESACPPPARVVVCEAGCRCTGELDCPCGMPVLDERVHHIWRPADLTAVLAQTTAAANAESVAAGSTMGRKAEEGSRDEPKSHRQRCLSDAESNSHAHCV